MKNLLCCLFLISSFSVLCQVHWEDLRDEGANFYDIQQAFEEEWEGREVQRGQGFNLYKRWEYFMEPRCYPSGDINIAEKYVQAWEGEKAKKSTNKNAGNWEPVGYTEWETDSYNPGNGRVNVIAKDPSVNGRYYVGTPSGGLWRTNDNFNTWEPLTDDLPTLGVSGIVIHPTNSDIIYIGTGDGNGSDTYSNGVLKSTDGGATWNTTGLSYNLTTEFLVHKLLMHPDDPETIFAATKLGLWKTTTGGEVWYEVRGGNIRDVEFNPADPNIMYCCTGRVYKSVDGGEDFDTAGSGMPSSTNVERMSLGVSADNPNYVYALCVDNDTNGLLGVWRSEDQADSFSLRADSPNILGYPIDGSSEGGQGFYDLALDVNPTNAENVWTGGINVWRSINGGADYIINAHWFLTDNFQFNYVHADIHNIQYLDNELFVCSDGGVFRSTNNGVTFQDVSEGLQINQFYRFGGYEPNPELLIGGTQDNGSVLKTGNTWTHVRGADGMEAAIHPLDPDVMYCASQFGGIYGSQNGGASFGWAADGIDDDGAWVTPYILHPEEPGTIIAGFTNIWKSTNFGQSWQQVTDYNGSATFRAMSVCDVNPNIMYACSNTQLFKSEDGGDSWSILASGLANQSLTYIHVNPSDEDEVYVTFSGFGEGNKIFKSTDGGENWENISFNLPNIPTNCVAVDDEDGSLYVGTDLGMYFYHPDLVNWMPFSEGLPNVIVNEIEINNQFNLVTAATYGRGIWRSAQFEGVTEAPTALFSADKRIICVGDSIQFTDLSFGHEASWEWGFPGSDELSSDEQHPLVHYNSVGEYQVSLTVSNDEEDDTFTRTQFIIVQEAAVEFPYSEEFGTENLQSYDFTSVPFEGDVDWMINEEVGKNAPGCLWINNGDLDEPYDAEVFSKQFDLSGLEEAYLSFWYAYAQKHPETDDQMRFYTSNTCGDTWVQRELFRGQNDLNTAGAPVLGDFVPDGNGQWLIFSYPLSSSDLSENFSFKLRFSNENGNHIYIDDINISSIDLSVEDLQQENKLTIYPNPTSSDLAIFAELTQSAAQMVILDMKGVQVLNKELVLPRGTSSALIDVSSLSTGMYSVWILDEKGEKITSQKLVKY